MDAIVVHRDYACQKTTVKYVYIYLYLDLFRRLSMSLYFIIYILMLYFTYVTPTNIWTLLYFDITKRTHYHRFRHSSTNTILQTHQFLNFIKDDNINWAKPVIFICRRENPWIFEIIKVLLSYKSLSLLSTAPLRPNMWIFR